MMKSLRYVALSLIIAISAIVFWAENIHSQYEIDDQNNMVFTEVYKSRRTLDVGDDLSLTVPFTINVQFIVDASDPTSVTVIFEQSQQQVVAETRAVRTTPAQTATPVPTSTPPVMIPTSTPVQEIAETAYEDICSNDVLRGRTDVQVEVFWESFEGKQVSWEGYVYDVGRSGSSYNVDIALAPQGFLWARQIRIEGVRRNVAATLSINDFVSFTAEIDHTEMFFGMNNCNPIVLRDATFTK